MTDPTYQKNIALTKDELDRSNKLKEDFDISFVDIYRRGLYWYEDDTHKQ